MKNFVLSTVLLCKVFLTFAQCPITFTSTSSSPASCPSGGSITVTASGTGNTYRILSGPFGYAAAANSTGFFGSLKAGVYLIQASNGACSTSTSVTVADSYPVFVVSTSSTSGICTSSVQGGTITATISGGRPPYQYDIVPLNSSPTYSANTTSTSFSKVVNSFGIYRFYAKDNCGEVRTRDVFVQPTQPKPVDIFWEELIRDRPCGETIGGLPTITWYLHFKDENGAEINDFENLIGTQVRVYRPAIPNSISESSNSGNCPKGALLNSRTVTAANVSTTDSSMWGIAIPEEDVILEVTTICGFTMTYCMNFNEGNPITPSATFRVTQQSCSSTWANQIVNIRRTNLRFFTLPVNVELTKANGTRENNATGNFYNLRATDFPVTLTITDACGRTLTQTKTMPTQGSQLQGEARPNWDLTCTNIKGTSTANIIITGGDLPGVAEATNVTISGGTVTAVPTISKFLDWMSGYYASNLLPCSTYMIRITNLCGEKDSLQFTVPCDNWGQTILNHNLTATTNRLCGQNEATIIANANFNNLNPLTYSIYNISSPFTAIQSNSNGIFNNLLPGTYKIKFKAESYNYDACPNIAIADSINYTLLPDNVNQSIIRKLAYNCETGGITQNNGRSTIEVNGTPPFTYEIIRTNLIGTPNEVWTVSSTNNSSNVYTWTLPLPGDPSNTNYTIRSTDKCDNKITTQAILQPLGSPVINISGQPCLNEPNYSVNVNTYVGGFTYRWVKLPDVNTVLSTSNTLTFPGPYVMANNGNYQVTISDGGCIEKVATINISSDWCAVLSSNDLQLTSYFDSDNGATHLKWTVTNTNQINSFKILRSINGNNFDEIGTVQATNSVLSYNFKDFVSSLSATTIYYKIKVVSRNGDNKYSSVVKVVTQSKNKINIYPNPATTQITVNVTVPNTGTKALKIINHNGQVVLTSNQSLVKGENFFQINHLNKLSAGIYIIEIDISETQSIRTKFIKK